MIACNVGTCHFNKVRTTKETIYGDWDENIFKTGWPILHLESRIVSQST